jgi:hypothetical protein
MRYGCSWMNAKMTEVLFANSEDIVLVLMESQDGALWSSRMSEAYESNHVTVLNHL